MVICCGLYSWQHSTIWIQSCYHLYKAVWNIEQLILEENSQLVYIIHNNFLLIVSLAYRNLWLTFRYCALLKMLVCIHGLLMPVDHFHSAPPAKKSLHAIILCPCSKTNNWRIYLYSIQSLSIAIPFLVCTFECML